MKSRDYVYGIGALTISARLCNLARYLGTRNVNQQLDQLKAVQDHWLDTGKLPPNYYDENGLRIRSWRPVDCECDGDLQECNDNFITSDCGDYGDGCWDYPDQFAWWDQYGHGHVMDGGEYRLWRQGSQHHLNQFYNFDESMGTKDGVAYFESQHDKIVTEGKLEPSVYYFIVICTCLVAFVVWLRGHDSSHEIRHAANPQQP